MPRHAWGIDLGDGTLKAVRVRREGRGYCIDKAIDIPYLDPFLKKKTAPAILDRRAIAALYQLGNMERIPDFDRFALGFSSFHAVEGVIEIPRVSVEQREALISYEVGKRFRGDPDRLLILHKSLRLRSSDSEQVQVYGVWRNELETFIHYLNESKVPYDRIISGSAALVDLARMCLPGKDEYLILSVGFSATHMVILQPHCFFSRTLPVGLPGAPSQNIEIARNRIADFCKILKTESAAFVKTAMGGDPFSPSRVMISGEGALAPALINTLDAMIDPPVEVLRPTNRIRIKVPGRSNVPESDGVYSMGKAIGLAIGLLEESDEACRLAGPPPKRQVVHKLPLLTTICGIILLLMVGLFVLEQHRKHRLGEIDRALAPLKPEHAIETLSDLKDRIDRLNNEIGAVHATLKDQDLLQKLGGLLSKFESRSSRDTYGDYHMERMAMDFGSEPSVEAMVATRLGSGAGIQYELKTLFPASKEPPVVEGPLPAEEETPPKGMAPLVLFRIKGKLH
ncbi:MAG: hypothetical protein KJ645_06575 [Planctomycetes bacterium]|nr:hypothetical protein [Planctomycetota bacterium]